MSLMVADALKTAASPLPVLPQPASRMPLALAPGIRSPTVAIGHRPIGICRGVCERGHASSRINRSRRCASVGLTAGAAR